MVNNFFTQTLDESVAWPGTESSGSTRARRTITISTFATIGKQQKTRMQVKISQNLTTAPPGHGTQSKYNVAPTEGRRARPPWGSVQEGKQGFDPVNVSTAPTLRKSKGQSKLQGAHSHHANVDAWELIAHHTIIRASDVR